jgi:hypothetical protein
MLIVLFRTWASLVAAERKQVKSSICDDACTQKKTSRWSGDNTDDVITETGELQDTVMLVRCSP